MTQSETTPPLSRIEPNNVVGDKPPSGAAKAVNPMPKVAVEAKGPEGDPLRERLETPRSERQTPEQLASAAMTLRKARELWLKDLERPYLEALLRSHGDNV